MLSSKMLSTLLLPLAIGGVHAINSCLDPDDSSYICASCEDTISGTVSRAHRMMSTDGPVWHNPSDASVLARSPRRITDASFHSLLKDVPDTPPPDHALFWKLWKQCEESAEEAYQMPFLQQLQGGVLSPDIYGAFLVSDLWYCYNGAASYELAVARTEDENLKVFLNKKCAKYEAFVEDFKTQWRIEDPAAIAPTDVARQYAELERGVATSEHPIYTLIVMLPCSHLWAWLGDKMKGHVDGNVYAKWITDNNQGFEGAYRVGNFLHAFEESNPRELDHAKALDLYTRAMRLEQENFGSP